MVAFYRSGSVLRGQLSLPFDRATQGILVMMRCARRALEKANLREFALKRERLRFLAEAGFTYAAAAREIGISVSAARAQYIKDGTSGREMRVTTMADLKRLRVLAKAGYTRRAAARELGIKWESTVRYWDLKENLGFVVKPPARLGPDPVYLRSSSLPRLRAVAAR